MSSKQITDDSRWGRWYLRMGLFDGRSLTSPVPFGIQSWAVDSGYDKLLTFVVPPSSKCVVTLWFYCLVMADMLSSSQQKNISIIRIPVFSEVENFSTKPALRWHSPNIPSGAEDTFSIHGQSHPLEFLPPSVPSEEQFLWTQVSQVSWSSTIRKRLDEALKWKL